MANVKRLAPSVKAIDNGSDGQRGTFKVPMANSSTHYVGEFFDPFTGTNGAQTYTADQAVNGIVEDIETYINGAYISVFDANLRQQTTPGTVTQPVESTTAPIPGKYVASSTNVTRAYPDRLVYRRITEDDTVLAYLGASGVPTARGTTSGTDTLNTYIEPDATYPWMLQESSVNASATGKNFQIVGRGKLNTQVVVKLINATGANS